MYRPVPDQEARCPTNRGDWVQFRASEVFLASPEDVVGEHNGSIEMEGVIVDFSDSGARLRAFAVVELATGQTIVVAVEKLRVLRAVRSGSDVQQEN
jgi:hypothetical protein